MGGKSSHYAAAARQQAQHILSQPPYAASPTRSTGPSPLARALTAIGRAVAAPFEWLGKHLFGPLGHGFSVALGPYWPIAAAAIAVGAGVFAGVLIARRRGRAGRVTGEAGVQVGGDESAKELERLAGDAESSGAYGLAVRLRFRAGLARLEEVGAIEDRLSTPDGELRRLLESETFDGLADRHALIAYGEQDASLDDARDARRGWPVVVGAASEQRSSR